jgi:prepilin-type N-terminal cleavage/methylation domain-containing protein
MLKNSRFSKRNQRGFGILEISVALVITAVAAAMVVGAFQDTRMKSKVKESMDALSMIHYHVKDRYSTSGTYSGVYEPRIAEAGFLPSSMIAGPGTIHHAFGREIHLDSPPPDDTFRIRLTYIPSEACMLMVTKDMGKDLVSVDVWGLTVTGRPMTPAEAQDACYRSSRVHPRWRFK